MAPPYDATLRALDTIGFAVVRGVFRPAEVQQMRAAFDRLHDTARSLSETGMHDGSQFVLEHDPFRIRRVVWCGAAEPVLSRFGQDPRLLTLASWVLRSRCMHQLINQAHFKLPGDEVGFEWHQDSRHRRHGTAEWTDVDGRGSFVEIVTALDPVRADNGPLLFIPGTAALGHIDPICGTDELPPGTFDPADAVCADLDPGDVVLFGPYVIHGSEPNRSDRPRRLFLNGFACPGANRRVYPGEGAGRELVLPSG